ncbi:MAG: hypothetical protein K0Q85_51 [Caproiciproducens sp.]|jgi:hypothetical protein|nr:hypothetical protein [Caproiciproducens sp.]
MGVNIEALLPVNTKVATGGGKLITLKDMGLKAKILIPACKEAGVRMDKDRASKIIHAQTVIKPAEMEVISRILNKTMDELYTKLGSEEGEIPCPLLTWLWGTEMICWSYACNLWDDDAQWCRYKGLKRFATRNNPTVETIGQGSS